MAYENDLNLKATELRLGLPGRDEDEHENSCTTTLNLMSGKKRASPEISEESRTKSNVCNGEESEEQDSATPPKAQVVGWPPVRSFRKSILEAKRKEGEILFVKVSMDGAPYLRKIDLKMYSTYKQLLTALESMFKLSIGEYSEREGYNGSEYAPTYQDKDGDWMLVGDVPWNMFISSCKRLRIMKGSDARGLGCF